MEYIFYDTCALLSDQKEIFKKAKQYFKKIRECLIQKKIEMIEELDFD